LILKYKSSWIYHMCPFSLR